MASADGASGHAALMDGVYRFQRHIYDATRKHYLLGRDALLADIAARRPASVLEAACGTGRNLALAARLMPGAALHGFDISVAMLETATKNLAAKGLAPRTRLAEGDATRFDAKAAFGTDSFDAVFVSYALSMIPDWEASLAEAWRLTAPGGTLGIVDFSAQAGWPALPRRMLRNWLALFHVSPREALEAAAHALPGIARAEVKRAHGDYCIRIVLTKAAASADAEGLVNDFSI
jgi:S-adenosylmethionine-diacylgycerolhomoserine-N-methlytransferase